MYNLYNKQLLVIFTDFFNFNLYQYETRQRYKLHTLTTNLGQETAKYTGTLISNDVMSIADFSNNKSLFKKSIRRYYLECTYNTCVLKEACSAITCQLIIFNLYTFILIYI